MLLDFDLWIFQEKLLIRGVARQSKGVSEGNFEDHAPLIRLFYNDNYTEELSVYTSKTISNRVWQTQQNNGRVLQTQLQNGGV